VLIFGIAGNWVNIEIFFHQARRFFHAPSLLGQKIIIRPVLVCFVRVCIPDQSVGLPCVSERFFENLRGSARAAVGWVAVTSNPVVLQ
jgi:hypothetical protein